MIRMEVACFFVIAFMAIIYFSAKREKTKLHKVFSVFLVMSMLHLILDGATIYTVNHLESIPGWINDILHRLFIGTMLVLFYLIYRYIVLLVEDESEKNLQLSPRSTVLLIIAEICAFILPIDYMETEAGNYSYGPAANTTYACIALYMVLTIVALCKYWKQLHTKKKITICVALVILVVASIYQALNPLALISGMGIMLINLSFYLTMENPDILLVKQVQQEKKRAEEANAAKSIFLSHVSHEIRTPMNAIVGMTDIMLRTDLTKEQQEYLANIKSSGNALVSIINDILDISKIEAGKMELVEDVYEIRPMLKDIRMMIQNRIGDKPVKLIYDIDNELPYKIYGDGLRIRQIIINLLNNAAKFTEKGHIKLTIKLKRKADEEIELFISVADTGQGIREEDLQKLFEAFEQVDVEKNRGKEGTGLGLSISTQLVNMMGGKLEVKSEYGVGSEFFFTIPQKAVASDEEETSEAEDNEFTAPKANILVVEDNEINRRVAVGLLAPLQMQVDLAVNGKEALDMIQKKKYHIVFMDHMMPVMDGVEAVLRLRQMEDAYYRDLPVIAFTANAMKETEIMLKEAGMNDFLAKPIETKIMYRMIRNWLPKELVEEQQAESETESVTEEPVEEIEGLDVEEGIKYSGSKELFIELLGNFYKLIDAKSLHLKEYMDDELVKAFTIEVHALKNSARVIGATDLSKQFAHLEKLGNNNNIEKIREELPKVLELYQSYKPILAKYGMVQTDIHDASAEELIHYLKGIQEAVDGFDLDVADEAMKKLEACRMPEICQKQMEDLRVFMADVAMENVLKITEEMIKILEEA